MAVDPGPKRYLSEFVYTQLPDPRRLSLSHRDLLGSGNHWKKRLMDLQPRCLRAVSTRPSMTV